MTSLKQKVKLFYFSGSIWILMNEFLMPVFSMCTWSFVLFCLGVWMVEAFGTIACTRGSNEMFVLFCFMVICYCIPLQVLFSCIILHNGCFWLINKSRLDSSTAVIIVWLCDDNWSYSCLLEIMLWGWIVIEMTVLDLIFVYTVGLANPYQSPLI